LVLIKPVSIDSSVQITFEVSADCEKESSLVGHVFTLQSRDACVGLRQDEVLTGERYWSLRSGLSLRTVCKPRYVFFLRVDFLLRLRLGSPGGNPTARVRPAKKVSKSWADSGGPQATTRLLLLAVAPEAALRSADPRGSWDSATKGGGACWRQTDDGEVAQAFANGEGAPSEKAVERHLSKEVAQ
jgi:hypothetical protein